MARLTINHRRTIKANAIKDIFKNREASYEKQWTELAHNILFWATPPAFNKLMTSENPPPREWFSYVGCLEIFDGGHKAVMAHAFSKHTCPFPYNSLTSAYNNILGVQMSNMPKRLHDRMTSLIRAQTTLTNDKRTARTNIGAMLNAINTTKALKEGWPEGESYYKFLFKDKPAPLPAIPVNHINDMIKKMKGK